MERDPGLALAEVGDPAEAASAAFPDSGPLVWKDPRVCLLLPHWLALLPKPVAAVFVWRSPLAVARSLRARDAMHLADGVALWERYNRSGLTGLVGVDTFVVSYESIVEDPVGRLENLASWLGDLGQFARLAPHWDPSKAAASISPRLRHQQTFSDPELLLGEHQDLVEQLDALDGPHRPLTSPPSGAESAWTTALLDDRRQIGLLRTTVTEYEALLRTGRREAERLHAELDGARPNWRTCTGCTSACGPRPAGGSPVPCARWHRSRTERAPHLGTEAPPPRSNRCEASGPPTSEATPYPPAYAYSPQPREIGLERGHPLISFVHPLLEVGLVLGPYGLGPS